MLRSLVARNSVNVVRAETKEGVCSEGMTMPKEVPRKRVIFLTANPSNAVSTRIWHIENNNFKP